MSVSVGTFLKGIILGVTNLIPGLSVGTVAVILDIFDKLIDSFSRENIKKNLPFLMTIIIGIVIGTFAFSNVIQYLFAEFTIQINYFFLGIVLGCIPMIYKRTNKGEDMGEDSEKNPKPSVDSKYKWIIFAVSLILMITTVYFNNNKIGSGNIITDINLKIGVLLVLAGAFCAFAMVVPGVSGTFFMLVLGVYPTIINSLTEFNFFVLTIFGIGCVIGILLSIKAIRYLLHHFYSETYAAILGLVLGSVLNFIVPLPFDVIGLSSVLLIIIGFAVSYKFS